MGDFLTWGAIILAGGSLVAVAKFWMDMGKAHAVADTAAGVAAITAAKHDLLVANFNEFRVDVAQTYATTQALSEAELSFARTMEASVQGIYQRLDNVTTRLDSLITIANRNPNN